MFTFKALGGETGRGLQMKPNVKLGLGTQLPSLRLRNRLQAGQPPAPLSDQAWRHGHLGDHKGPGDGVGRFGI